MVSNRTPGITARASTARPVRIATAGVHGFGLVHLRAIAALAAEGGVVELEAVADPVPAAPGTVPPGVQAFDSLPRLLESVEVDLVTIATPIHTHLPLARAAMEAGADVLLEKPPVPSMNEFEQLIAISETTGRSCQIGFQSLGSHALPALRHMIASGLFGEITGVGGIGLWLRSTDYWARSPWAGRRTLDGVEVMDGVVTNPLAHAVITALHIAGSSTIEDVASVETELFRANAIESDDTSVVRIMTEAGIPVVLGLTLCAPEQSDPTIIVHGSQGSAVFHYTSDDLDVSLPGEPSERTHYSRTSLLTNLIEHRIDPSIELLAPVVKTGAFLRVVESVRSAPAPTPIDPAYVGWRNDANGRHPVVQDVEYWLRRASGELRTLRELGVPWAENDGAPPAPGPKPRELTRLAIEGRTVASYVDGSGTRPSSTPRPYLRQIRTLAGVEVSDDHPLDHDWHLGVGVAIQDVDGTNLWGGRTYVRDQGYLWRHDHGEIVHRLWVERSDAHTIEDLDWLGADGDAVLRERRTLRWSSLRHESVELWALGFDFLLEPVGDRAVELGSPGSHGREGGGYGGFFWRLPPCTDVDVRTPEHSGEAATHGSRGRWLAWTAEFDGGAATLVTVPRDPGSAADPWFVRHTGYPGFGSSLAWDSPITTSASAPVSRGFRTYVVDGRLSDTAISSLVAGDNVRSH